MSSFPTTLFDVLADSFDEAARTGHLFIESDHLILAILRRRRGNGCKLLRAAGVKIPKMKEYIDQRVIKGKEIAFEQTDQIQPGDSALLILALTMQEVLLDYAHLAHEMVILAVALSGEGAAADYLDSLGLNFDKLKAIVDQMEAERGCSEPIEMEEVPIVKHHKKGKLPLAKEQEFDTFSPNVVASLAEQIGRNILSQDSLPS